MPANSVNWPALEGLQGSSVQRSDVLDSRRWRAYYSFFGLSPQDALPLAIHWLLFNELSRDLRDDGHPVCMPPFPEMPFPRRMWAGGEIVWMAPLSVGSKIKRTTVVARAQAKDGSGGPFLLATLQHTLDVDDTRYVDEQQNIVFLPREARPGAVSPRPPPFEPQWSVPCRFGAVDLFRYSALTLNSHRIHYDESYATTVEGYPGLVVHGPLLATRLMHAAAALQRPRETPMRFSYRSIAPVFAHELCQLAGRRGDGANELAVLGPDGDLRMMADMSFCANR